MARLAFSAFGMLRRLQSPQSLRISRVIVCLQRVEHTRRQCAKGSLHGPLS
jgi:hypothetical protein